MRLIWWNSYKSADSTNYLEPTDAGGQRVVPGPPLARHALERGGAVQRVSRLAAVRDAAPGEVTLVVDLEAELRHAGVLAVRQLKTCKRGLGGGSSVQRFENIPTAGPPTEKTKLASSFFPLSLAAK